MEDPRVHAEGNRIAQQANDFATWEDCVEARALRRFYTPKAVDYLRQVFDRWHGW